MSADSTTPVSAALMGVELRDSIARPRSKRWPTLADSEYVRVLELMAQRFPGLEVLCLRFAPGWNGHVLNEADITLVEFRGLTAKLLEFGLLQIHEVPVLPKRLYTASGVRVRRAVAGKMIVLHRIMDHAHEVLDWPARGAEHPLAFLRPSQLDVYRESPAKALGPHLYLRLVIDNTRPEVRS